MIETLDRLVREIGEVPWVRVADDIRFPSGAASISVEAGGRMFGLDYSPGDGRCIVYDVGEQVLDVGPREHFANLGAAAARLVALAREAAADAPARATIG